MSNLIGATPSPIILQQLKAGNFYSGKRCSLEKSTSSDLSCSTVFSKKKLSPKSLQPKRTKKLSSNPYFEPNYGEISSLSIKLEIIRDTKLIIKRFSDLTYKEKFKHKYLKTSFLSMCDLIDLEFDAFNNETFKGEPDPGGLSDLRDGFDAAKYRENNLSPYIDSSSISEQNTEDFFDFTYEYQEVPKTFNFR
ncbi:MAG: hypothetical protein MHPSP_002809 [Paramarteilia canceri]